MAEPQSGQIVNVMKEERLFPPPRSCRQARISSFEQYEKTLEGGGRRHRGLLGQDGRRVHWFKPYEKVLQWDMPFAKWFVGGQTNISYNCLDIHLGTPRKTRWPLSGKASRAIPRTHLPGCTRSLQVRQRAQVAGHPQGRRGGPLHADDSRASHRHAGLRPDRRHPFRGFRRFLSRGHRRPQQRRRRQADDHCRRRLAARQARSPEAKRRPRWRSRLRSGSASSCGAPAST